MNSSCPHTRITFARNPLEISYNIRKISSNFVLKVYCGFEDLKMNYYLEKSGGDWVFKLLLVLSPPLSSSVRPGEKGRGAVIFITGSYFSLVLLGRGWLGVTQLE
jgi:hypothetical protein